jgi:monoamine oxidase
MAHYFALGLLSRGVNRSAVLEYRKRLWDRDGPTGLIQGKLLPIFVWWDREERA